MKTKNNHLIVVKIGGSTLGQHDTTLTDLVELQKKGFAIVVIHGGGKIITEWLGKQGTPTRFVQGERVTDEVGLQVATAVLSGIVNKELVAKICALGGKAIGISGVDGLLLQGKIKNPDLGYVGVVHNVNIDILDTLLKAGYLPVVSSIGLNIVENPDSNPLTLNINADIAAGEIAAALGAEKLIYLTDIAGICDKTGQVISQLNSHESEELINSGVAISGMIPKIRSCIRALDAVELTRIIDGRRSHALLNEIYKTEGGTTIYKEKQPEVS